MVLEAEATIVQSKGAHTQYLVIPSVMVQDSQYPFKAGDKVNIVIDTHQKILMIKPTDETEVKASPDSANKKGKKIMVEKEIRIRARKKDAGGDEHARKDE